MLSQQMTDMEFFKIMAGVYNIKLDEADEWSFISAAREDRALVMNDRSQLDTLQADLKAAQAENARLQTVYKAAAALIRSHVYADSQVEQNACMAELFRVMEALQPAEVSDHDDQPVSE